MGKKKQTKKLALKKETVRKLDALNEAQLKDAAGGAYLLYTGGCIANTGNCFGGATGACIRTTTYTCGCEPGGGTTGYQSGGYC